MPSSPVLSGVEGKAAASFIREAYLPYVSRETGENAAGGFFQPARARKEGLMEKEVCVPLTYDDGNEESEQLIGSQWARGRKVLSG